MFILWQVDRLNAHGVGFGEFRSSGLFESDCRFKGKPDEALSPVSMVGC